MKARLRDRGSVFAQFEDDGNLFGVEVELDEGSTHNEDQNATPLPEALEPN